MGKAVNRRQRSQSRARLDDSSGDELADTAILYNVPDELARLPSSHRLGTNAAEDITHVKPSDAVNSTGEDRDKPLPPTPPNDPLKEPKYRQKKRPALAKKTTNMKSSNSGETRSAKPHISSPMLQETTNATVVVPDPSRPTTSHTTQSAFAPQTSIADAANLSRKISTLMEHAAAQEEQTKLRTESYIALTAKASPLERGKNAFVKATRAIKERLNNGGTERPLKSRRPTANRHSSFQGLGSLEHHPTGWRYEALNGLSREKLERRIAEGENLSNPKIRSLTGDGNIPRKPLPVYESMRSRSMRSKSPEDPFSEGRNTHNVVPPQDYSGFNFNFSKDEHDDNTSAVVESHVESTQGPEKSNHHLTVTQSTPRYSNMISGLVQHPDVMFFSSSPLAHSTPRVRLEPPLDANNDDRTRRLLTRSPSVPHSSLEDPTVNVRTKAQSPQRHQAKLSDGSNLSVKRKEATEDLRAQLEPVAKKVKTNSNHSKEDLGLLDGLNDLVTGDERTPLSIQNVNAKPDDPVRNTNKRKGMSIFDVGKGKAPERREDGEPTQKTRSSLNAVKRSSITRPNSLLFTRGRSSWTGIHRLTQADDDSMDIDELQIDDAAYQIGGKKK